jgi:hypothetical protein
MENKAYDSETAARTIYSVLKSSGSHGFKVNPIFKWIALNTVWMEVLVPTTFDSCADEPLYVYAKVRPLWYWSWRRIRLFLSIVGRGWDDGVWVKPRVAWNVACVIYPKDEIAR